MRSNTRRACGSTNRSRPGVSYIRGRTGQQTLFLYDGLRSNHALFDRDQINIYSPSIQTPSAHQRRAGERSVDLGNDAVAGAILLKPLEPQLDPNRKRSGIRPP